MWRRGTLREFGPSGCKGDYESGKPRSMGLGASSNPINHARPPHPVEKLRTTALVVKKQIHAFTVIFTRCVTEINSQSTFMKVGSIFVKKDARS